MSGFKKKVASKAPAIPGTVISPKSLQLLTSSGVASLDALINGGFPVGTLVLFEDNITSVSDSAVETSTSYSKVLTNHFLEEGVSNNHELFVGSCGAKFTFNSAVSSTKKLAEDSEEHSKSQNSPPEETLKIAWRYKHQNVSSEVTQKENSSQILPAQNSMKALAQFNKTHVTTWSITDILPKSLILKSDIYHELFKSIYEACSPTQFGIESLSSNSSSAGSNLIRIAIVDIGALSGCDQEAHGTKVSIDNFKITNY